jgi:hypothetical protein
MTGGEDNMQKFISKPSIDMLAGIVVHKDTTLEYENENVKQTLKDLVFDSTTTVKGENFTSEYHTVITLNEGDVLIFAEEGRGYIKPVEQFVIIAEAIEELKCIKD